MNLKGFFVTALSQALDLAIATPEDVLRHVTPDLLAEHLPRPLWARLLTACVGAARVDAQLVVETIGVPNLCEHLPTQVIWSCITDIGHRSLGREGVATPTARSVGVPLAMTPPPPARSVVVPLAMTPPPPAEVRAEPPSSPAAVGPNIPAPAQSLSDVVASLEADERAVARPRTSTQQSRFRQSNTGIGRLANTNAGRRPQASAVVAEPDTAPARPRRGQTEADTFELETEVRKEDWKASLAVEDEQLVEWSASDETVTSNTDDDLGPKR